MMMAQNDLPVVDQPERESDNATSCGPTAYVTLEESAIAAELRKLRDRGVEVRERIDTIEDDEERVRLEEELQGLRRQRQELQVKQEQAWRRKMIMLGHLREDDK
jgi:predicted nucleotide-binding protein (sugar kinase/HSP70/actin superfamily)